MPEENDEILLPYLGRQEEVCIVVTVTDQAWGRGPGKLGDTDLSVWSIPRLAGFCPVGRKVGSHPPCKSGLCPLCVRNAFSSQQNTSY